MRYRYLRICLHSVLRLRPCLVFQASSEYDHWNVEVPRSVHVGTGMLFDHLGDLASAPGLTQQALCTDVLQTQ